MNRMMTVLLLVGSNMFMTYAWYGHLKDFKGKPLILAIVVSWGVAFLEYCLQVPANRIGYNFFSLSQLKILQEIITISVFAVFSIVYMKQQIKLDYLWAAMCIIGAAFFMFRSIQPLG